eukprot:570138-Rhodomonas_salina.2
MQYQYRTLHRKRVANSTICSTRHRIASAQQIAYLGPLARHILAHKRYCCDRARPIPMRHMSAPGFA